MQKRWVPPALLLGFSAVWVWAAIGPSDRHDWLLENLLVFLTMPVFIVSYFRFRLTDGAYALLALFMTLHVVGSHWTYSNVPFGYPSFWNDGTIDFSQGRNMYDRVVHFCYGLLLSYPLAQFMERRMALGRLAASYLSLEFVVATSALYEVIEWITAMIVSPELADSFLGQQGDTFDAVADIAMAGLGAIVAMGAYAGTELVSRRRRARQDNGPALRQA